MQNGNPLVTAVIPTHNRPDLVGRAVRSALAQTYTNIEVIVVLDGPDEATVSALQDIQALDARLRILPLPQSVGANDTRNAGIKAAKGEWIALLDDDDEWMPQKLEKQIELGLKSSYDLPVLASQAIHRSPEREYVYPRKQPFLPIADFQILRTELSPGEGTLPTSTLAAPTHLFRDCPFTSGLPRHQEFDWLMRAFELPGVGLEFVSEPLAIYHYERGRPAIGATADWRGSLQWINQMRQHLSDESYASFLLISVGASALGQGDWKAFLPILILAFRRGKPKSIHLLIYFVRWMVPHNVRRSIRVVLEKFRKQPDGASEVT